MNHSMQKPNRSNRGFTLIEMITVVTVIGIVSALMVPMLGDTGQSKLIAAANLIAADVGYAQIESISHADDLRFVVFDLENNSYFIAPTSDLTTPVTNPIGNKPYLVNFGTGSNRQLNGVTISSVSMNGDNQIRFGIYGELDQATNATVTLTCEGDQITIIIDPTCGDIGISEISAVSED